MHYSFLNSRNKDAEPDTRLGNDFVKAADVSSAPGVGSSADLLSGNLMGSRSAFADDAVSESALSSMFGGTSDTGDAVSSSKPAIDRDISQVRIHLLINS